MSESVSSQSVAAMIVLVNEPTGRPANLQPVERCRVTPIPPTDIGPSKRWLAAMLGPDTITELDVNGLSKQHVTTVLFDAVAFGDGTTPADVLADEIGNWCTKKLDGAALPGIAERVEEVKREPTYSQQGDFPCCELRLTYHVHHTSRIGNAELRY